MIEVQKVRWNGLYVASLFAGAGGSSLGYRMAGYRVLWANEFVPAAQASYRANMARGTILCPEDVRKVKPAEVLRSIGLRAGELDLFDGSPPCQAFSTAGRREKGWGTEKRYEHGAKQRNEDLFAEYVRLLRGLMPRAFVAENVSGLVKGVAKGYFIETLAAMKACGYAVEARLLDAQWLGVPQARQRIIFVGVREDLDLKPAFPDPLPYRYSVREAIPWIAGADHDTGRGSGKAIADRPAPTVTAGPDDANEGGGPRNHFKVEVRKVANGDSVPDNVAPTIEGYAIEGESDKLSPGASSEKFFNLARPHPERPCPTVTSQGAGGGGSGAPGGVASVIHPTEKRKFTIAELRRICSFPDDFVLTGTYAQQWERLGNSVPPLMMRAVAEALRDRVLLPARAAGRSRATRRGPAKPRAASPPKSRGAGASRGGRTPRPAPDAPNDGR